VTAGRNNLPNRGQPATSRRQGCPPDNVRERDTGERGPRGRERRRWGRPLPDRGQAADAHRRCRSYGRPVSWGRGRRSALAESWSAARSRGRCHRPLPPASAARANGRRRWRKPRHLPDRGQAAAHLAMPGPTATSAREHDTGERRAMWAGTSARPDGGDFWASTAGSQPGGSVAHVTPPGPTGAKRRDFGP
jgi:hypothetical protein